MPGIVYHYIKNNSRDFPKLKFLHKNNFLKQINYLNNKKKISSFDNRKKNKFFLTFDDGLKDHLWAAKKLKKMNLSGIFFISSYPFIKNDFLKVHKVHLLCGKFNHKILYNKIKSISTTGHIKINKKYYQMKKYQFDKAKSSDEIDTIKLKILLNSSSFSNNNSIIDDLFNFFFSKKEQRDIFSKFYLNLDDIHMIKSMGMSIGAHSHSHLLLTQLNKKNLIEEIDLCRKFLNKNNLKTNLFSYPFGFNGSYNVTTNNMLLKKKFNKLFVVNNTNDKILKNVIPRLNCNYFKYGEV